MQLETVLNWKVNGLDEATTAFIEKYPTLKLAAALAASMNSGSISAYAITSLGEIIDYLNPNFPTDTMSLMSMFKYLSQGQIVSVEDIKLLDGWLPDFREAMTKLEIKDTGYAYKVLGRIGKDGNWAEYAFSSPHGTCFPLKIDFERNSNLNDPASHSDDCPVYHPQTHSDDCPVSQLLDSDTEQYPADWEAAVEACYCLASDCNCESEVEFSHSFQITVEDWSQTPDPDCWHKERLIRFLEGLYWCDSSQVTEQLSLTLQKSRHEIIVEVIESVEEVVLGDFPMSI